jgi:FKBP-type peptidyl-prolyl cis-trans isomerase SlyD
MTDEDAETADDTPADAADAAEDVEDEGTAPDAEAEGGAGDVAADADESDADDADIDAESEDGIADGDFVRLSYTVRTKEDDRVVDTTDREVAEEAGIDEDDYDFEPRVVVVGAGHVFGAVDDELVGKEAGHSGTVDIPATEAFGEFDPDDVRTISAEKIDEDDRYPGARVTVDGEQGHVERIIGGRARVDFNHPLAGQDLEYDYEILEVVEDRVEQAKGLLGMYLQQAPEVWIQTDEVEEESVRDVEAEDEDDDTDEEVPDQETELVTEVVEKESLYIEATPGMTMNQQWLFSKRQIAQQLIDRLGIDRVVVQETIDGMGGMGMGGMMGGMGGGVPSPAADEGDAEDALEDVDIDAEELVEELDAEE